MTYTGIAISPGATVSYLEETTLKGTMEATPAWIEVGIITGGDVSLGIEHVPHWGIDDADRRVGAPAANKSYEFSCDFYINDVSWAFLKLFDGTDKTYSLRIEQPIGGTAHTHYMYCLGARLSEMSVSGSQGGMWEASTTIPFIQVDGDMIVDVAETGETEYTPSTEPGIITNVGNLATGTGWTTGISETMAEVTDVEVGITHNVNTNYVLNSGSPEGIYFGRTEVSFSFTANWLDNDTDINNHFARFLGTETGQLILNLEAAAYNITLSGCVLDELSISLSEGDKTTFDISGTSDAAELADA